MAATCRTILLCSLLLTVAFLLQGIGRVPLFPMCEPALADESFAIEIFSDPASPYLSGSRVQFSAKVTGETPEYWSWFFPEGLSPRKSDEERPTVMLGKPGTYQCEVVVKPKGGGLSATKSFKITVEAPISTPTVAEKLTIQKVTPSAPTVAGQVGEAVEFKAIITGGKPTEWIWQFESGTSPSVRSKTIAQVRLETAGTHKGSLIVIEGTKASEEFSFEFVVVAATRLATTEEPGLPAAVTTLLDSKDLPHATPVAFTVEGQMLLCAAFTSPLADFQVPLVAAGFLDGSVRVLALPADRRKPALVTATIRHAHNKPVKSIAFSQDGRLLATGSADGSVKLWETAEIQRPGVKEHAPKTTLPHGHEGAVLSLEFQPWDPEASNSPHAEYLLASGGADAHILLHFYRVTKPETNGLKRDIDVPGEFVWDVSFSADGKYLACASAIREVLIWDVAQADSRPSYINAHEESVLGAEFSVTGNWLVSGGTEGQFILNKYPGQVQKSSSIELPGMVWILKFLQRDTPNVLGPRSLLAAGTSEGHVWLFDPERLSQGPLLDINDKTDDGIVAVGYDQETSVLVTATSRAINFWFLKDSFVLYP